MERHKFFNVTKFPLNNILKLLTLSDSFIWGSFNMINTIVAVYLKDHITENPLEAITFGFSIYMLTKSIFQIPIAKILDKNKSYMDESISLFISGILTGLSILSFKYITEPIHLYLAQALFGLGVAFNLPAWRKTFAKFLDKGNEAIEYSVYDILASVSIAFFTALGGYIINKTGSFVLLFNIGGTMMFMGGLMGLCLTQLHKIHKNY